MGQYFDARGRREIGDHRPTVNLYLPHQQGTSPYWLLEVEDAERLGVALLQEAALARRAATLLSDTTDYSRLRRCPMCSAETGQPCKVLSNYDGSFKPGDVRPVPHFYRTQVEAATVSHQ